MLKLTDSEFELLKNLLYQKTGISLTAHKKALMFNRLYSKVEALNLDSFIEYYNYLANKDKHGIELESFIDAITTNETYFLREPAQFEFMTSRVLSEIIKRKENSTDKEIKVWCSACSTGEEAYSIAISLEEEFKKRKIESEWKMQIYASDINKTVLESAKNATYHKNRLEKVRYSLLQKYFISENGTSDKFKVKDCIRKKIQFFSHNLKSICPFEEMDVIFCRNVLIYFDNKSKTDVIANMHDVLSEGGYLFLGQSETIMGNKNFDFLAPSTFRKK